MKHEPTDEISFFNELCEPFKSSVDSRTGFNLVCEVSRIFDWKKQPNNQSTQQTMIPSKYRKLDYFQFLTLITIALKWTNRRRKYENKMYKITSLSETMCTPHLLQYQPLLAGCLGEAGPFTMVPPPRPGDIAGSADDSLEWLEVVVELPSPNLSRNKVRGPAHPGQHWRKKLESWSQSETNKKSIFQLSPCSCL